MEKPKRNRVNALLRIQIRLDKLNYQVETLKVDAAKRYMALKGRELAEYTARRYDSP